MSALPAKSDNAPPALLGYADSADASAGRGPTSQPRIGASGPSPLRPLVVVAEDQIDQRVMMGAMLDCRGFEVILAVDGRQALYAVVEHHPDAVVSDLEMPNLDGLGLCRALRALRAHAGLPIVMYTAADPDDSRVRDAYALGGVEVLSKSAAPTQIGDVLRRLIPAPRLTA